MDVESLLRDALDLKRVPGEPSLGFDQRVVLSLPDRPRRNPKFVLAFVGMTTVLALVAVIVPWYLGGASHGGPAGASPSPSVSGPTETPTATPVPLTHARAWGLEFDYPTTWRLANAPSLVAPKALQSMPTALLDGLYPRQVFGYVGTTTPETVCTDPVALAKGGWTVGVCSSVWSLGLGDVVLRFQKGDITTQNILTGDANLGETITRVGGLPALFSESSGSVIPELAAFSSAVIAPSTETAVGAERVMVWELPGNPTGQVGTYQQTSFRIVAAVRGPNTGALEAEAQALVASIKYDPAVVPLPTDPTALATLSQSTLRAALDDNWGPLYPGWMDCFPREPGSKSTTIVLTPDDTTLSKPLPVTCSVAIEPNAMEGWTVTLTVTWDAASDRKAGRWSSVDYVSSGGYGGFGRAYGSDVFPYEVGSGQPG
jgi:hypothetical protein